MYWPGAAGFMCLDMYFLTPPDLCRLSTADPGFDLSRADAKYANWSAPFPPSGLMIIVSITIRITENASTHSLCHPSQSKGDPIIASVIRISDNRLVQIQSWLLPLKTQDKPNHHHIVSERTIMKERNLLYHHEKEGWHAQEPNFLQIDSCPLALNP